MRRRRLPPWLAADAIAPALPLGYALGRVGCFLVGDDYGRPTDLPWGVEFPVGLPPTDVANLRDQFGIDFPSSMRRRPAGGGASHAALRDRDLARDLDRLAAPALSRSRRPGTTALAVLGMLAIERFAIEFLRAKDDRVLGGFTAGPGGEPRRPGRGRAAVGRRRGRGRGSARQPARDRAR